jgi:hypothetical protein
MGVKLQRLDGSWLDFGILPLDAAERLYAELESWGDRVELYEPQSAQETA